MSDQSDTTVPKNAAIDNTAPAANFGRLFLLGIVLVATAVFFALFKDEQAEPYLRALLGVLSMTGVFFIFSMVLGFIRMTSGQKQADFSRQLIDGMDAGVLVTDGQGRIVYANATYGTVTSAIDNSGINTVEHLFSQRPESSEAIYRLAKGAREGKVMSEEFRLAPGARGDGAEPRWYRVRARQLNSEIRDKPLTVWQISDITAGREKQESTFQELQNAINYLDHAPVGFFSGEPDGSLVYLNATLADWLGIDLTEFRSGSMSIRDLVVGDGMALLEAVKAEPGGIQTAVVDLDLAKSNGQRLPVRLYHRVPFAKDGTPGSARTMVINRAISEPSEDALRSAEIRFTRFFDSTPIAIAAVSAKGKIARTNAPFMKLFADIVSERGNVEGLAFSALVTKNDSGALQTALEEALSGKANIKPVDSTLPSDENRSVRFFISPVADHDDDQSKTKADDDDDDKNGSLDREEAIVYAMETTEQRVLEEQFNQSQKMQAVGQLAGGIAHDFNNVLTAIIGFSDLLLTNHRPSDPSFQDIMNIKQNANRAASLVRQLLAFSRRQTLHPQILSLGDALSDLRMLLDRLLGEKVQLEVVHGRDLWPVKVDISQFEQVVINLAVNARDAMPNGGKVVITTANLTTEQCAERFSYKGMPAADYVLMEVEDNGTGMSAAVMEKIFEPFYSTKEVGKGTGLGLSTVYGIIKQTEGFIYPDSEEGKGTLFRVFLPRQEPEVEAVPNDAAAEARDKPKDLSGSATILLVEDEDAVRAFAGRALVSRGYQVHEATSGVEALEVMQEHGDEIDLIVSDVVMPEMDGPTLLNKIRETRPDLKFIFISGYAEGAFSKNLPEGDHGEFGFLPKPFSLKQLATTVKEILDN